MSGDRRDYYYYNYRRRGYGGGGKRDDGDWYLARRKGYDYDYHNSYDRGGGGSDFQDKADRHSGSLSGFGGHHGGGKECCPLVVKPLVILALLGTIGAATAFFNVLITMNIPAPAAGGGGNKRRRRAGAEGGLSSSAAGRLGDVLLAGREKVACPCQLWQIVVDCKSRQTCLSVLLPFDLVCH